MNKYRLLLLLALTVSSFLFAQGVTQKPVLKKDSYSIQIIPATAGGFGYDIYNNNKLFIHQPSVPALPGNSGFATKAAAEKVAQKVVEKMQKGESPPTLTIEELKQLGAIPR